MINPFFIQWASAAIFALAVLHTFSTKFFERLAYARPVHSGLWHLLGEVEIAFGFWAIVLMLIMLIVQGSDVATRYMDSRNFTEPLFVFVMMVIAATRPILQSVAQLVSWVARQLPLPNVVALYFTLLALVPILGSFITEPAAMTLAALLLRDRFFSLGLSTRLKYITVGVLLVNISIGGTLTAFAAPPVLMVAKVWHWDTAFMLMHFGWKAAVAVIINASLATFIFRKELILLPALSLENSVVQVPAALKIIHLLFLAVIVFFAHHPSIFLGLFLFFLGVAQAYEQHQNKLILREGLLVAFFLAGLVVLGGLQQWWLQPLLMRMDAGSVFLGAAALTAIIDNAALTYLGAQVTGLSDAFKYALVAGAVTGGGLTVIANAPNPAGFAILRKHFTDQSIHPAGLFLAALFPTLIAAFIFNFL